LKSWVFRYQDVPSFSGFFLPFCPGSTLIGAGISPASTYVSFFIGDRIFPSFVPYFSLSQSSPRLRFHRDQLGFSHVFVKALSFMVSRSFLFLLWIFLPVPETLRLTSFVFLA